jgi:hypothetical protein
MPALAQSPAKQLIPQPNSIRVDDVRLAIVSNLLNLAFKEKSLYLVSVDALGLSWHAHDFAELVQRSFAMGSERGENIAQVDCVLGVSVEVGSNSQSRRRDAVDHGTVTQNGQVEAIAVERHELRRQLSDLFRLAAMINLACDETIPRISVSAKNLCHATLL